MDEAKRNPFVEFWDSPWFGIGLGIVIGAFGSLLSVKWLIVAGWILICIQMFRTDFVRKGMAIRVIANVLFSGIFAAAFIILWHVIPKPPEPLSKRDIQDAVAAGLPHAQNNPQYAVQTNSGNATKADITKIVRTALAVALPGSDTPKTTTTPPSAATQIPVPEADQTKALKGITSAWTKSVDDWADSRLKDVPETSLAPTEEDRKKVQDFDEKISVEWRDRFSLMAHTFLGQYYQINLLRASIHACSGVNLGSGERGKLETFKECAGFIQGAADQLK